MNTPIESNAQREFRVCGDTVVEFNDAQGRHYSIRDVGIGHPMHTVGPNGGRVSTDAEVALALALIEDRKREPSRKEA